MNSQRRRQSKHKDRLVGAGCVLLLRAQAHPQNVRIALLSRQPDIEHKRAQIVLAHLLLAPILGRQRVGGEQPVDRSLNFHRAQALGRNRDPKLRPAQRGLHGRGAHADFVYVCDLNARRHVLTHAFERARGIHATLEENVRYLAVRRGAHRQRRRQGD